MLRNPLLGAVRVEAHKFIARHTTVSKTYPLGELCVYVLAALTELLPVAYRKRSIRCRRVPANPQCAYGNRKKPWLTPFAWTKDPVTTPQQLMLKGVVACTPSPGASNKKFLPLAVRTKPWLT